MKIGNKNVKVLKKQDNRDLGLKVELTSKMTIKGEIIKAVVLTNIYTGKHLILKVYNNLYEAFKDYKKIKNLYIIDPWLDLFLRQHNAI